VYMVATPMYVVIVDRILDLLVDPRMPKCPLRLQKEVLEHYRLSRAHDKVAYALAKGTIPAWAAVYWLALPRESRELGPTYFRGPIWGLYPEWTNSKTMRIRNREIVSTLVDRNSKSWPEFRGEGQEFLFFLDANGENPKGFEQNSDNGWYECSASTGWAPGPTSATILELIPDEGTLWKITSTPAASPFVGPPSKRRRGRRKKNKQKRKPQAKFCMDSSRVAGRTSPPA
jgi:hypothetical protein